MTAADLNQTRGGTSRAPGKSRRRHELAAFLRSRRERITPTDVGLPPGPRRRTPGLRREEVALLAGVGVTWYTWLEQGRPINASVQVLNAIARALRLDQAENEHLYRLADVPTVPAPDGAGNLPPEVQTILDSLDPLPASVLSSRHDVLAWNQSYAALFPRLVNAPGCERNTVWHCFTVPSCCNPIARLDDELPLHVAVFRAAYSRHLGEPGWKEFVNRLCAASPEFARLWATHDVAYPGTRLKVFRHPRVGEVRTTSTSFTLTALPDSRMAVLTPSDEESRERLTQLAARPQTPVLDHTH